MKYLEELNNNACKDGEKLNKLMNAKNAII